jgi:hypothetical protein
MVGAFLIVLSHVGRGERVGRGVWVRDHSAAKERTGEGDGRCRCMAAAGKKQWLPRAGKRKQLLKAS